VNARNRGPKGPKKSSGLVWRVELLYGQRRHAVSQLRHEAAPVPEAHQQMLRPRNGSTLYTSEGLPLISTCTRWASCGLQGVKTAFLDVRTLSSFAQE
jgi:hypothetical protein